MSCESSPQYKAPLAQAAACQAGRCYYTAHTQMAGGNAAGAHALFDRTMHLITVAAARHQVLAVLPAVALIWSMRLT